MLKFIQRCSWIFLLLISNLVCAEVDISTIIKVYTISNEYNYAEPWQAPYQVSGVGTGFVIEGRKIITNAHVVSQTAYLQVKVAGNAEKYEARVVAIDHVCDLAILEVNSDAFWSEVHGVLEIGEMPKQRNKVTVLGFPIGGDELSYTEGIVSRLEMNTYAHSGAKLLTAQIDAPINPGNSGGPVVHDGKVIGVAHQGMNFGQNIGYMIPASVLKHFLSDHYSGNYRGFTMFGFQMQPMENPALREVYGMKDLSGVLITHILEASPAINVLQCGDVVTEVEGTKVFNDGSVKIANNNRVDLGYVVTEAFKGDKIKLTILRNGEVQNVMLDLTLSVGEGSTVPLKIYDVPPTYYINAGIVFQPLTTNYFNHFTSPVDGAITELLYAANYSEKTKDKSQTVIVSNVLTNSVNLGYEAVVNSIVKTVNGKEIGSMQDLINAFESNQDKVHVVIFTSGMTIALNNLNAAENKVILDKYSIAQDRSENLIAK